MEMCCCYNDPAHRRDEHGRMHGFPDGNTNPRAGSDNGAGYPAPAGIATPAVTYPAWTTETPATGHPYSKTFSFSGSGDYQDFTFTTDNDATWVFRMDPGQGYFLVSLKDAQGNEIEVLPTSGTKSIWLKAGDYYFDIAADAPWHITMTTP